MNSQCTDGDNDSTGGGSGDSDNIVGGSDLGCHSCIIGLVIMPHL